MYIPYYGKECFFRWDTHFLSAVQPLQDSLLPSRLQDNSRYLIQLHLCDQRFVPELCDGERSWKLPVMRHLLVLWLLLRARLTQWFPVWALRAETNSRAFSAGSHSQTSTTSVIDYWSANPCSCLLISKESQDHLSGLFVNYSSLLEFNTSIDLQCAPNFEWLEPSEDFNSDDFVSVEPEMRHIKSQYDFFFSVQMSQTWTLIT